MTLTREEHAEISDAKTRVSELRAKHERSEREAMTQRMAGRTAAARAQARAALEADPERYTAQACEARRVAARTNSSVQREESLRQAAMAAAMAAQARLVIEENEKYQ